MARSVGQRSAPVTLVLVGMGQVTAEVEKALRDNPPLVSHLGSIEKGSFSLNWPGSLSHDDEDTWVYNVKGIKGSGRATVKSTSEDWDTETIVWATLELPSGKKVELVRP